MSELKPCPFCKSTKLTVWHISYPKSHKYFVECNMCHWCGETKLFKWRAKRAWNRRADHE